MFRTVTLPLVTSQVLPVFILYKTKPHVRPKDAVLFSYRQWGIDTLHTSPSFIKSVAVASNYKLFPILFVDGFAVSIVL